MVAAALVSCLHLSLVLQQTQSFTESICFNLFLQRVEDQMNSFHIPYLSFIAFFCIFQIIVSVGGHSEAPLAFVQFSSPF